ncbi:MAG: TldD/PmbA family protein [Hyphomonadaceae bacterium]
MSDTPDYQNLLADLIAATVKAGADAADARISTGHSLSVEVRNGELEAVEREESRGISLRALVGQRQAHVSGSDFTPSAIRALCERVVDMARLAPEDRYCGIASSDELTTSVIDLDLDCDDTPDAGGLEDRARDAEAAALAVAGVKQVAQAGASWSNGQTWVAASNGFSASIRGGSANVYAVAIAERDGAMERDYESWSARRKAAMKAADEIGRVAGERAVARLAPRKLDSGSIPVIYENRLASRLLGAFIGAISGPAVARGVSFLREKMGEQIFAKGVNIVDDPLKPRGFGSRSFDGEGRPVSRKALIDDGVLTQWLLNGPAARQLGLKPNGFASYGFGDPPGITTSNITIEPGEKSLEGLMAEAGKGLLVTDMFGPSLNPNTGDYSVGVSGFWFEDGQRAFPVSEVTIAGDLPGMFRRLAPGSDLEIRGAGNAPSLLIDGMSLAGL